MYNKETRCFEDNPKQVEMLNSTRCFKVLADDVTF